MKRGRIIFRLVFCLVLLFILSACAEGGCGGIFKSGKGGVPVMVEKVKVREVSPVVTVNGQLVPSDKANIEIPYDATVGDVYVSVGSFVNKGDPLFRVSEEKITNDLNLARARQTELEALVEKNTTIMKGREGLLEEGKVNREELSRLEKEISLNEAELERVKADIVKLTYSLEHALATSPISGMVILKNVGEGETAKAGEVLMTVVNINPIIVSFALSSKQSKDITIDMPLKVMVHELPGETYNAKVTYVSPELHRVGNTFEVWAAIANDDLALKSGMSASTEFVSDSLQHSFIIPSSAVMSKMSQPYVYKVERRLARKTPITIGAIFGDQIEVIRGLEPGDIVVVKGGEDLFDGADVMIWR